MDQAPQAEMSQQQQLQSLDGAQSQSPQVSQAATAPSPLSGDPLVCQWQGCPNPNHPSAELLYDHVCEVHIGRKSTNNLNLQCFWGSCRTTTVKRDHITSHIRVHVPLKPHKCEFCNKSFKRPQDLKKHVKTHADESVLFNTPPNAAPGARPPGNGYAVPSDGRDGSYGNGAGGPHMNYPYGNGAGPYQGGNGLHTGFGPYPYNVAGASSYDNGALTESRKRAHDQMNDFFGDAKRRNIDPGQYQDLGARFSQFLQMFAPFAAGGWNPGYNHGFGGGGPSFDNGGQYQTQAAPAMGSMNPPFPELRTKNDLMSIDQFLEQLQHTVYDNEGAAQNFQPIAGMQHSGFGFQHRNSNSSPPRFGGSQTASATTPGSYPSSTFAHSTLDDTPSSYQQGHSPTGAHQSGSPNGRGQGGSLYPTLLSFSSLEHHNQFASGPPTSLPPSGLGPQYDENDGRRRYSGGYLQRAKPASRGEGGTDDEPRPTSSKGEVKLEDGAKEGQTEGSPAQGEFKLPSVSEITREQQQSEGKESEQKVEARASWERNLETLAAMRNYVIQRLQRGEYEGSGSEEGNRTPRANQDSEMRDEETSEGQATTPKREGASLYPVLRPVEA